MLLKWKYKDQKLIWRTYLNHVIGSVENTIILDLGCGDAKFSTFLSCDNVYIGVDIDLKIEENISSSFKGIELILADAMLLPFRRNAFEIVLARELLHHVRDPVQTLREMQRIGKRIIVIEANKHAPYMAYAYFSGHKHFTPQKFNNLIIESRLGQKMSYVGVYPYRELSLKKTLFTFLMFFYRAIFSKDKIYDIIWGIFLSHTRLLEDLLFYLWYFAPKFFFYSRLFRNRLLGLEMIFDSGYLPKGGLI